MNEAQVNQLIQLKRLNPNAAAQVQTLLRQEQDELASDVLTEAMLWQLKTLSLWEATVKNVRAGFPSLEGRVIIGEWEGRKVEMVRQPDDSIRLYCKGILSPAIGKFGRDYNHISSASAGKWMLIDDLATYNKDDARRVFDDWLAKVSGPVAASRWGHRGNGWGKRY